MYSCRDGGDCPIDRLQRNRCRRCRLNKCLKMGMRREAVQCERKPIPNSDDDALCVDELSGGGNYSLPFQSQLSEEGYSTFKVELPSGGVFSMDYVYELATRLLFHAIDWARLAPSFNKLPNSDQIILLQSSWCDVFLLNLVQCARAFPLESTLALMVQEVQKYGELESQETMLEYINKLKDLLFTLERLKLTGTEFVLLKFICLFNPDVVGLNDVKEVERLQETAQSELQELVRRNHPQNQSRFARILLRLPAIKTVSSKKVEEMFFSPLIGEVKIDHIMPSILNNTSDVSFS